MNRGRRLNELDYSVPMLTKKIIFFLVACVMSSCARVESSPFELRQSDKTETINVLLKEWYILPEKRVADESNITFNVTNQGRVDHEFIVIKTERALDAMPMHEHGIDEKKAGILVGEIEDLRPGETKQLTVYLPLGRYVLFCNRVEKEDHKIISHYRHGMRVVFTVIPEDD